MIFIQILRLLLIFYLVELTISERKISKREEETLDREHRQAICCAKKMRCCVKPTTPPIEIRAILARCPNRGDTKGGTLTRMMNKPVVSANEHSIKSFQGFDEDEPLMQSRVLLCQRKILMTLKMHHKGAINTKNQYIVIDHVYDPSSEKSVRLLNPYVLKLKQDQVLKAFLLKFVDYVNSEAREQVYNKHDANFTGCYTDKMRATCGVVKYDGKVIPYSEGFCCSCDSKKNADRQPESINEKNEAIVSYSDPAYLLDRVQCPRNYYKGKESQKRKDEIKPIPIPIPIPIEKIVRSKIHQCASSKPVVVNEIGNPANIPTQTSNSSTSRWQYSTYSPKTRHLSSPYYESTTQNTPLISHSYLVSKNKRANDVRESDGKEARDYFKNLQIADRKKHPQEYMEEVRRNHIASADFAKFAEALKRRIRQTFPSGVQKRGGQNCANRFTPPGLDPDHYHESAHCLRFSDVWYGIYKLGEPFVEHGLYISIYERFETEDSPNRWREITNGTIRLSNRNPLYEDETPTISIFLTTKTLTDEENYANLHSKRILIPEGIKTCDTNKYPEMRRGPEEFLVVRPDQIAIEGDQCDKIGVGFEAFTKQPQRCALPRGTCLHNQPKHLWKHDKAMEKRGKRGCYFLKYHANITSDPILVNETTGDKYLEVEYTGAHMTNLDIEIKADFNAIIRQTSTAVITEIYIDSTCEKLSTMTIKVINTGLISNKFMVQLSDFPLDYPEGFNKIKSKMTLISPQNQHVFTLEIRYVLPTELLYCSVEVLNGKHELVALRRARIQKYDRCICTWHCLCACVASSDGLRCLPMSLEHYHAAGFQGALPVPTHMVHLTLIDDIISVVFYFALFLLAILLILGLVKAILGLCCLGVGMWGLNMILDLPKRMKKYYEPSLRCFKVIYDDHGWPIHPSEGCRVRNISRATEFCTNVVFFFTYPLASCMGICRRLCCSYYTKELPKTKKKPMPSKDPKDPKDPRKKKPEFCPSKSCPKKTKRKKGGHTTTSSSPTGSKKGSSKIVLEDELCKELSGKNILSIERVSVVDVNKEKYREPCTVEYHDDKKKRKKFKRFSKSPASPSKCSAGSKNEKFVCEKPPKKSKEDKKIKECPAKKCDDKKAKRKDKKNKAKLASETQCLTVRCIDESGRSTPTTSRRSSNRTVAAFITETTGSPFVNPEICKYHDTKKIKGDSSLEGQASDHGATSSAKICQCRHPKPISTKVSIAIKDPSSSLESTSKEIRKRPRRRDKRRVKSESTSFTTETSLSLSSLVSKITPTKEDISRSSLTSISDSALVTDTQDRDTRNYEILIEQIKRTFEDENYKRTYSSISKFTNRPKSM